ncbi:thioesterase II family protein [Desulfoluna butyratoxydans]|uniref:Alpha/beta hydrolase fold n=1 Tax=Desulfoluna butyratoxydans TaxID=231438 RepID=A0A4U8YS05_9BACT|nr:alpha/beta fold hydrolase [Desulfoluna butyratoxydans]VFQ46267.1 alpha/beta hydrolase fold [Desulfoluna butyratoxydans]
MARKHLAGRFPSRPAAGGVRLFCFPFAGGGASIYSPWRQVFPESVEVVPVQLPGRENRLTTSPFQEMGSLVHWLFEEVTPLLDKPFVFFGHSMGAQVAFELASLVRTRLGLEPLHFFASACHAPHLRTPPPLIGGLTDEAFLRRIADLGGTPEAVLRDKELTRLVLPVLRADFFLTESYRTDVAEPLGCPVTALCGSEDYRYNEELIRPWRRHSTGPFSFHVIKGGHFFLRESQGAVLEKVGSVVDELLQAAYVRGEGGSVL